LQVFLQGQGGFGLNGGIGDGLADIAADDFQSAIDADGDNQALGAVEYVMCKMGKHALSFGD
jgi:hypothetical protein